MQHVAPVGRQGDKSLNVAKGRLVLRSATTQAGTIGPQLNAEAAVKALESDGGARANSAASAVRTPASGPDGTSGTRIRRRVALSPDQEARTIRRTISPVAADAEPMTVAQYLEAVQDTGRTLAAEAEYLFRLNGIGLRDVALGKLFAAFSKASKGADADALRVAVNALATAVNPQIPALIAALADVRDMYSDISDALESHFSGNVAKVGDDEKLLAQCASSIKQAVFQKEPKTFVEAILAFRTWLKLQTYSWAYDDFVAANEKELKSEEEALAKAAPVVEPPDANVVTLAELRAKVPNGQTAGQRYAPDKAFGNFRYHVSVSFKIIGTKANLKLPPAKKKVEIETFHVSFEPNDGGDKTYYWWKKAGKKGSYQYSNNAGVAGTAAMLDVAKEAVKKTAPTLNCVA